MTAVEDARGWLLDCFDDPDGIADLSEHGIRAAVEQHYKGGWREFLASDPEYAEVDEQGQLSNPNQGA